MVTRIYQVSGAGNVLTRIYQVSGVGNVVTRIYQVSMGKECAYKDLPGY